MSFIKELEEHIAPGYHLFYRYSDDFKSNLEREGFSVSPQYIGFINSIGYGRFFGGGFILFPLYGETGSIKALSQKLNQIGFSDFVAIGYDGTTEGYYCLKNDENDNSIYWANVQTKNIEKLDNNFDNWVNRLPSELFSKKIYSGYKKIKDLNSIFKIIEERSSVEVELLDFEKQLSKASGTENSILPRYNKITLAVRKNKELLLLDCLTIAFFRSNSSVENDNIEYLTIDIKALPIGKSIVMQGYLFDVFNVPFDSIECLYEPYIDLRSKTRTRFKEIEKYL